MEKARAETLAFSFPRPDNLVEFHTASTTARPVYGGKPFSSRWMLDRVVNTWRCSKTRAIRRQPKP